MSTDSRTISVSTQTYDLLRKSLGNKGVKKFVDEIIQNGLDDPTICDRLLKACRVQNPNQTTVQRPRRPRPVQKLAPVPMVYGCKEPREIRHMRRLKRQRLKRYDLTEEAFAQMYAEQNGRCWICNGHFREEYLVIDHCHRTFKVRGLLCSNCNLGLGAFQDNIASLIRAVLYLDPKHEIGGLTNELSAHLGHEAIDNCLPDVGARRARPVRCADDRIDNLHGRYPARNACIEDHAVGEAEPAVLDRSTLAVDDVELVLARVDDEVDRAREFVTTKLIAPRA